jgi:hypothetical protein
MRRLPLIRIGLAFALSPLLIAFIASLFQGGSILEQYWDRKEGSWNHTIRLSKMISGGESSLERISQTKAMQLLS